jgi:putative methionine-R-sulfoxide reductase with GAF domain
MCYSLQLTNRFKDSKFEIHIASDEENSELLYLLFVDEKIIGIDDNDCVDRGDLATQIFSQRVYAMPQLN